MKRKEFLKKFAVISGGAFILTGTADCAYGPPPDRNNSLKGKVLSNGAPVKNAAVNIEGSTGTYFTDEKGSFIVKPVFAGERKITVSKEGYENVSRKVMILSGETVEENFELALK